MKLGYGEFSFAYAYTENLIAWTPGGVTGAPIFPNLVQEGSLGFDIRIDLAGLPLFLQYKLPEKMVRDSAAEVSVYQIPGLHTPFFRMYLMKKDLSQQHDLLVGLEQRHPGAAYYVTPCMWDEAELSSAYMSGTVHLRSVLFSPSEIGPLPDTGQHCIAYQPNAGYGWFCSDPREVNVVGFEDFSGYLARSLDERSGETLGSALAELRESVLAAIPVPIRGVENAARARIRARQASDDERLDAGTREVMEELLVARELARLGLGIEMLIAQKSDLST